MSKRVPWAGIFVCSCSLVLLKPTGRGEEAESAPIIAPPPTLATPSSASSASPPPVPSVAALAQPAVSPTPLQLTDVLFKGVKARAIGPAVMGGRVSDIVIDPRNPAIFYVGLGTWRRVQNKQ